MPLLRRKLEAAIGGKLLQALGRKFLKDAELIPQQITLPKSGLVVHYYERKGTGPTLILCHGFTDEAKNMAALVIALKKELPTWRFLLPDQVGHGMDLPRVQQEGIANLDYPKPRDLLQNAIEFLQALQIEQCTALGISMGGALVYFLQEQQPTRVTNAILINPALECTLEPTFLDDFRQGRKNHFCVESRADIKHFFRDLSIPNRKKKNPVPKFFLEAIWQDNLARVPRGHYRKYFETLLDERGKDPEWLGCTKDIAPQARRLVIWPPEDHIANYEKGKAFFADSPNTLFHSVPDCGHLFHSDGKTIIDHTTQVIIDYLKQQEQGR